jgi:hypothetical protein
VKCRVRGCWALRFRIDVAQAMYIRVFTKPLRSFAIKTALFIFPSPGQSRGTSPSPTARNISVLDWSGRRDRVLCLKSA